MAHQQICVIDAPSNLGLRPPAEGVLPGCYKSPWALRGRNLIDQISATDGGSLVPPSYCPDWEPGTGDRNAEAIATFSIDLANRLEGVIERDQPALVLGGDCSILIGNTLALKRRGRYGLVFLDAHSDFRHPENAPPIGAAAGEDLAIITGRGDSRLTDLEGLGPYVQEDDIHVAGVREEDEHLSEMEAIGIAVTTNRDMEETTASDVASRILQTVGKETSGFWIHFDVDVVDASEMPAVDCPEEDGPSFPTITALLAKLLSSPHCLGLEVTIYDPDLDPSGKGADRIVQCLTTAYRKRPIPNV